MAEKWPPVRRPILVAIDLSPCSERALAWAADAADSFDTPLVVLHVVHGSVDYAKYTNKRGEHIVPRQEAASAAMMDWMDRMRVQLPRINGKLEHRLVAGLPGTRILEVAEELCAEMVVMGSRGQTGLKRLLLGSTSASVTRLSPVPVTIVKSPPTAR